MFGQSPGISPRVNIESSSINILKRGRVTEFVGDVTITGENYRVNADRAVSYREKNTIEATGNVRVVYSTDTGKLEGWCDKVIINQEKKIINLTRNVRTVYELKRSAENDRVEIRADEADIDYSKGRKALYKGDVEVVTGNTRIFSDKARYSDINGILEFGGNSGQPRAVTETSQFKSVYKADSLNYYVDEEYLESEGNAHARIYINESEM